MELIELVRVKVIEMLQFEPLIEPQIKYNDSSQLNGKHYQPKSTLATNMWLG